MKIYLDYIFLENLIINFLLIYNVSVFTKSKPKILNKVIAVLTISIYTTMCYVIKDNIISSILIKILIIMITVYIAYVPKKLLEYIKKLIYYIILNFSYVGIIISTTLLFNFSIGQMRNRVIIYTISFLILYFFNKYLWKLWKSNIKANDLTYTIYIAGQEIQAFVDTGNSVKDYVNNLDVIFLDNKWYKKLKNVLIDKVEIEYNTAISKTTTTGYIIKNIKVYKNKEYVTNIDKIAIAFIAEAIDKKEYSALIGYNTYIESLKGVMLC